MSEIAKFYDLMIKKGVRYAYQYKISVTGGSEIATAFGNGDYHFYAQGFTLPARTIAEATVNFQGMTFKLPNNMTYTGTIDLAVNCDKNMTVRTQCETWMNKYGDLLKGGGGYKRIPQNSTIRLDLLNETLDENDISRTYTLLGCWPSNVGNATLGQGSTEILTFPMTLVYQYYVEGSAGADPNGFKSPIDTNNLNTGV